MQASQETQVDLQWIVAQRLLSTLTAPGFDLSRLQKSYRFQDPKTTLATKPVAADAARTQYGRHLFLVIKYWKRWATLLSQLGF